MSICDICKPNLKDKRFFLTNGLSLPFFADNDILHNPDCPTLKVNHAVFCSDCHKKCGCQADHDILMFDTGTCSVCGKNTECVNCIICAQVEAEGISPKDHWESGKPRL